MALAGWLLLGAIAGIVVNRLNGESARNMPITIIGAMTGALLGGTIASAALGHGAIDYEALIALIALTGAAGILIRLDEGRLGE